METFALLLLMAFACGCAACVAVQCVRQAVLMAEPSSEVFEVRHTGYVVLKHTPMQQHQQQQQPHMSPGRMLGHSSSHAGTGTWRLTSGCGDTGVLWIEDDDD
jgi:hypothetical protein